MHRRMIALVAVGLLAVGLAACSSSSKSSPAKADITIQNFTFTPSPVKAGSTVTVQNKDAVSHTVTADNGAFNVTVHSGSSATFKAPATAGTYKLHCNIHSSMHASLTVT
jgi:plastocyanin